MADDEGEGDGGDAGDGHADGDDTDPGLAVVLHVADKETVRSIKKTLLTAILVRSVRMSRSPPRRGRRAVAVGILAVPVLAHGYIGDLLSYVT